MDGWVTPEDVVVSEVSRSQKDKYHMAPLTWESQRSQIHRDQGWGEGARDSSLNGDRVPVHKDEKVWRWMVVMAARQRESLMPPMVH